ncbi:MAG TPA: DNA primase, partial [Saprospiraceae bacterium]|nr:DNA primase [Saprospiraceae bacterium]
ALEQDLNVKICLLPDGHDPDSYVRDFGGEALRQYAAEQAKDFILFKTELLTDEASGDPVKRAALIKDIVGSIARIPDPVKRSVYLKQCASLMQMSEDMLTTEANKIIGAALRKREEKVARQPGAASDSPPPADWGDWPSEMPPPSAPEDAPFFPETGASRGEERPMLRGDEFQERDIIRLLVQFGDRAADAEGVTVGEYVLADIEDSLNDFDNPLYARVAAECHALLLSGKSFDQHHFTQHPAPEVRDLALDLLATPWEFSPNWEAMWNYPLQNQPMPELNFDADMKQSLNRFKLRKVQKMCALNQARIKAAADAGQVEEMMHYLKIQQKLNETRNALAQRVGTVVLGK